LNKQKEEAKGLVGKFKEDVKDLKSAWAKNLNIESMMSFASPEEIIAYQNRKVEPRMKFSEELGLENYLVPFTLSSQIESRTKKD